MDRKKLVMGLFIIVIMVSSTAGFILSYNNNGKTKSNGKDFVNLGNYWLLREKNADYYFYYLPEQVPEYKEINLAGNVNLMGNLTDVQLNRLSYVFAKNGVLFQQVESEDCSSQVQTIVLGSEPQNFYKDGNCLFLQGDTDRSIDIMGYSLIFNNGKQK